MSTSAGNLAQHNGSVNQPSDSPATEANAITDAKAQQSGSIDHSSNPPVTDANAVSVRSQQKDGGVDSPSSPPATGANAITLANEQQNGDDNDDDQSASFATDANAIPVINPQPLHPIPAHQLEEAFFHYLHESNVNSKQPATSAENAKDKMLNYCIRMLRAYDWVAPTVIRAMKIKDLNPDTPITRAMYQAHSEKKAERRARIAAKAADDRIDGH